MNMQITPDIDSQAKAYARGELTSYLLKDGYKPTGFHTYTDATCLSIYWKIRLRHDIKGKTLRAFACNDGRINSKTNQPYQGQFMPCEPDFKSVYPQGNGKKPLYRLHELLSNSEQLVFIVEGEQKADLLSKLGLIATTSGSTGSVNTTDWQPLAGRTVRIWRDNDDAGVKYQDEVKFVLESLGCDVSIVDVDALGLPVKGDAMDLLARREEQKLVTTKDDVLALALVNREVVNSIVNTETDVLENQVTEEVTAETSPQEDAKIEIEKELERLASLSTFDYERCRVSEAKRLGNIRSTALDKMVKAYQLENAPAAGGAVMFEEVEPWDEPVNGALLLDAIAMVIEQHIVCERHTVYAVALWIMFTWCIDAAQIAPIACITAPEKRCGKSQLLRLMAALSLRPLKTENITAAALFRSIEKWQPTLFIDEADTFLKENEDMRGVLNAGYEKNGCVIRTTGDNHEPTPFRVFGAKAISGIGHLPDTLKDRSIILELRRKQPNETRVRLRHADMSLFERLKQQLARWADDNLEALRVSRPVLPDALNDRAQDSWESLLAIADLAGGHWGKTARHSALAISGVEEDAPSINEELLADIKQAFNSMKVTRISSVELLERLCRDDEAPWGTWSHGKPMTPRKLSQRLSDFGISSKTMRDGSGTFKGYELSDFKDAFNRYLKVTPAYTRDESVTRSQPNDSKAFSQSESVTSPTLVTDKKPLEPLQPKDCYRVTDKMPQTVEIQQSAQPGTDSNELESGEI